MGGVRHAQGGNPYGYRAQALMAWNTPPLMLLWKLNEPYFSLTMQLF